MSHRIIIIGGGFAGVKCAQELTKLQKAGKLPSEAKIRLISDRKNFEYHGALYRVAMGATPLEVCFPLREITDTRHVDLIYDRIEKIDREKKNVLGKDGEEYHYDTLVIALGAQTVYFGIPGLEENAHSMKTIAGALELKTHIHEVIAQCAGEKDPKKMLCNKNFVVVGAGATGVEVAGEIIDYGRKLAARHDINPSTVAVELVEAQGRILSTLPEDFAKKIHSKLEDLGVQIMTETAITESNHDGVVLANGKLDSQTIIWTAGVRAHKVIEDAGLEISRGAKAVVCKHLHAKNDKNIFIAGDCADTKYAGMAQTAMDDGVFIARVIAASLSGEELPSYAPREPIYAIPAGYKWAGVTYKGLHFYGSFGWFLRRLVDVIVFVRMAPLKWSMRAFSAHYDHNELCTSCKKED